MKRVVLLFSIILLAIPASAILVQRANVQDSLQAEHFSLVTCERAKQLGAVHASDKRLCCVNLDKNNFCGNNEPTLGECDSNLCIFQTRTFRSSYTYWNKRAPCPGLAILTGKEHDALLSNAGCQKSGQYWCCSPFAFMPQDNGLRAPPGATRPGPNKDGALLVLSPGKWKALEFGYPTRDKYAKKAYSYEQDRCEKGGEDVRIIDRKYGSFFADTRNIQNGMRAFFITPDTVVPLITWC